MTFEELSPELQEQVAHLFDPANPVAPGPRIAAGYSRHLLVSLVSMPGALEYLDDEEALREYLKKNGYVPNATEDRIRHCFWLEYENSLARGQKMQMTNIHSLICDEKTFKRYIQKPQAVAFFLCKPMAYKEQVATILSTGLRQMQKILAMDDLDSKGKPNVKLLELKTKITAMMDMRLHGAPTQNIKQLNVNVDASPKKALAADAVRAGDMGAIQKRLAELEMEKKQLEGRAIEAPVPVPVKKKEPEPVEIEFEPAE